jgi:hypothetical protein
MRTFLALGIVALLGLPAVAVADIYTDTIGDVPAVVGPPGNQILDIVSLEATNTLTDISFTFTLNGDVIATDWGKYIVAIHSGPGGDPVGNGWARPISMPTGMNVWLGSWLDSGTGLENRQYLGGSWQLVGATYLGTPGLSVSATTTTVTLTTTLASLGLAPGNTIQFDAFTTGGGGSDTAMDSLANPNPTVANWSDPYTADLLVSYTVTPEPGTIGLLLLGAVGLLRRRR